MKLRYASAEDTFLLWEEATFGEVYQSADSPALLAIKAHRGQGLCIRTCDNEGISLHEIWTPGPRSKWRHVPSQLTLPTSVE